MRTACCADGKLRIRQKVCLYELYDSYNKRLKKY
jgi:hypothetical protein